MGILHTALTAEDCGVSAAHSLDDLAKHLERLADSRDLSMADRAELMVRSRKVALFAAEVMQIITTGAAGRLATAAGEAGGTLEFREPAEIEAPF